MNELERSRARAISLRSSHLPGRRPSPECRDARPRAFWPSQQHDLPTVQTTRDLPPHCGALVRTARVAPGGVRGDELSSLTRAFHEIYASDAGGSPNSSREQICSEFTAVAKPCVGVTKLIDVIDWPRIAALCLAYVWPVSFEWSEMPPSTRPPATCSVRGGERTSWLPSGGCWWPFEHGKPKPLLLLLGVLSRECNSKRRIFSVCKIGRLR